MTTILIVDDDADSRDELAVILADEGYAVCQAMSGEEALALLDDMPTLPQVMLLDLIMPKMDGRDVLDTLARTPRLAGIPVVVVSALPDLARALPHARQVTQKPVDLGLLLGAIEKLCA